MICQIVLMEIPRDHRRFLMADTGITVQPSLEDKADILRTSVNVAHALGVAVPRVALVAATETVKAAMPETVDAHELTRRHEQGEFASCLIQGPLSFDLAYAQDAGDKKRIGGTVVGAADVYGLSRPALGQPHRQGDHVHCGLPVRRRAWRHRGSRRFHVPRR